MRVCNLQKLITISPNGKDPLSFLFRHPIEVFFHGCVYNFTFADFTTFTHGIHQSEILWCWICLDVSLKGNGFFLWGIHINKLCLFA